MFGMPKHIALSISAGEVLEGAKTSCRHAALRSSQALDPQLSRKACFE